MKVVDIMKESTYNSCRQYEIKLSRKWIGHTRLTYGYLMSINEQQPTRGNQRLTIKHCLQDCPQWKDSKKKHSIQGEGL